MYVRNIYVHYASVRIIIITTTIIIVFYFIVRAYEIYGYVNPILGGGENLARPLTYTPRFPIAFDDNSAHVRNTLPLRARAVAGTTLKFPGLTRYVRPNCYWELTGFSFRERHRQNFMTEFRVQRRN